MNPISIVISYRPNNIYHTALDSGHKQAYGTKNKLWKSFFWERRQSSIRNLLTFVWRFWWVGEMTGVRYNLPLVIGRDGIHRSVRNTSVTVVIVNRRRRTNGGLSQCTAQITSAATGVGPMSPRRRGRWIFATAVWPGPRSGWHKVLSTEKRIINTTIYDA